MNITIITVCYNAAIELEKTLNSVLKQSFCNFEYIVVDGASNDKTLFLLKAKRELFSQKNIHFKYISEPDNGIYDAMNKGARLAENEYILYLNAGDEFYDNNVLQKLYSYNYLNADIIYGSTFFYGNGIAQIRQPKKLHLITKKMVFCHQSVFVRRELLLLHPFNTNYKICADYETFLFYYISKYSFVECPLVISKFQIGGASKNQKELYYKDLYAIHIVYLIKDSKLKLMCNIYIENFKNVIRRLVPIKILEIKNQILN